MWRTSRLIACALSATLMACAAPQRPQALSTPSGNPEIVIPNVTRKAVVDKLVAAKLEKGMQIRSVYEYGLSVGQKMSSYPMASFLFGSSYDATPELRYTYNLVDVPGGVRVFSRSEIITNPGSGFERPSDITQRLSAELQAELVQLRSSLGR